VITRKNGKCERDIVMGDVGSRQEFTCTSHPSRRSWHLALKLVHDWDQNEAKVLVVGSSSPCVQEVHALPPSPSRWQCRLAWPWDNLSGSGRITRAFRWLLCQSCLSINGDKTQSAVGHHSTCQTLFHCRSPIMMLGQPGYRAGRRARCNL
jgi:hypothetical protein